MSRKNVSGSRTSVLQIPAFDGMNTALAFSDIKDTESRDMLNGLPGSIGSLKKRPGTIPLSETALAKPVRQLFPYSVSGMILGVSGDTLYEFSRILGNWAPKTMTNKINEYNRVDMAEFKNESGQDVVLITDGGALKYYNGSEVKNVAPAANDESPLPANDLTNINSKNLVGCLVHNTRLVVWSLNDTLWHSKIGYYDYFPQTDYQRFVREGDAIQTCITFGGALLVFMRNHVAVLFGHDRDDWSQDFLDTGNGCINPNTVQIVTYPDGRQEVFYLSDDGIYSIYTINTLSLDNSIRYSSKSVTKMKVDWERLGVARTTLAQTATAYFHNGQYWMVWKEDGKYRGLVFDTSAEAWYPIDNVTANAFYADEWGFYFAGDDGHFKTFDASLYSDYQDKAKTLKTPINLYWYSKITTPRLTGHDHLWDILIIQAKQQKAKSTLDVEVNTYKDNLVIPSAVKTAALVWGVTEWGESEWANEKLTDLINNPQRLRTFLKGQYVQIKLSNNRDEPMEIHGIRYEVRVMDTYY